MEEKDNSKTATYENSDYEKTNTYEDSGSEKTSVYDSGQEETATYSDSQDNESKSKTHGIGIGDKILLKDIEYSVTEIISEGTGEAVIYKVEDGDKNIFALKLYLEFKKQKEEPNFETLKRIKDITDPDILKLYDFGVGADKYQDKYCYEISDFAEGGDLFAITTGFKNKYTPDFIEKSVIPQLFNGIKKLHGFKIYHCDLKPSNIFFKDKEQTDLLIGDYGSAKAYDLEAENDIRQSSTVKGTDFYLAPELAKRIVTKKADYYSLGMVLLHLLYSDILCEMNDVKKITKGVAEAITTRQYKHLPIINYNSSYRHLNNLIEGLTLTDYDNRFGENEVEKWLKGEEIQVRYKTTGSDSVQPVKLGYATIKTEKDFINFVETQPNWYQDLIEDQDTFSTVKNWMDSYRDIPSRKVFDSMIKFHQPLGKEYVKESLLRYFDPEREIRIDMNSFNFFVSKNIKEDVEAYISKLDDLWKFTDSDHLDKNKRVDPKKTIKFYLFQLECTLYHLRDLEKTSDSDKIIIEALLNKLLSSFDLGLPKNPFDYKTEIQNKISSKDEEGTFHSLLKLFYAFNPKRVFKGSKGNSIKSLEELGFFYVENEAAFNDKYLKAEKEMFLQKLNKTELNSLDYKSFIFEVFKDKAETQIELVGLKFDKYRDYEVKYKYYKSLTTFFSQKNISIDFTSRSDTTDLYKNRKKFFQSFNSECKNFVSTVTKKHNIAALKPENISAIHKKFVIDSWKCYLHVHSGQFFAFLVAIPLAIIIYGVGTHKWRIGENWISNLNQLYNITNYDAQQTYSGKKTRRFYRVRTNSNIRSGPSAKSSILSTAYKDQEVEVLDTKNPSWYKVKIDNTEGYIRSTLLTYSRQTNH